MESDGEGRVGDGKHKLEGRERMNKKVGAGAVAPGNRQETWGRLALHSREPGELRK